MWQAFVGIGVCGQFQLTHGLEKFAFLQNKFNIAAKVKNSAVTWFEQRGVQ
jgi:hypothetical protein